jgi:hypothetical protein
MSGNVMSIIQDLISDIIPSQKCLMNMDPILKGHEPMAISNSEKFAL